MVPIDLIFSCLSQHVSGLLFFMPKPTCFRSCLFLRLSQKASGLIFFILNPTCFRSFLLYSILKGLFIKVNFNVIDYFLLKGLISGLLQSILESPCGIPTWNPHVESLFGILARNKDYGKFFRLKF